MVSTSLLLCALILDAEKKDEKEMELMEWVLELLVEYAKRIYVVAKRAQGRASEMRRTFHFFSFSSLLYM